MTFLSVINFVEAMCTKPIHYVDFVKLAHFKSSNENTRWAKTPNFKSQLMLCFLTFSIFYKYLLCLKGNFLQALLSTKITNEPLSFKMTLAQSDK